VFKHETDYGGALAARGALVCRFDGGAGRARVMAGKVLIVADAREDQEQLERIVSGAGYSVAGIYTGNEALRGSIEPVPDLIVVDVTVDDMDGFKVCRDLSTSPGTREAPVIMISDGEQKVDRLWAEQQGAGGVITKPYSPGELIKQLRRLA
jgi:twitching motility two-component system response regulator PilH